MLLNLPDFVRSLLRLPSRPDKVESLEVNMFSLNRKDDQVPRAMGRRSFLIGAGAAAAALAYGYLQRSELRSSPKTGPSEERENPAKWAA